MTIIGKPSAVVEDVLDGFCSFQKLIKLHLDLKKLRMISSKRMHYNWNELKLRGLPSSLAGIMTTKTH